MATKAASGASYTFTSQPRALAPRRKFRDEEAAALEATHFNLMNDPRVVRGNTFRKPLSATSSFSDTQKLTETQRQRRQAKLEAKSPEPVQGRVHMDVQTELYLEELSDKVQEADVQVQTDPFLDRPPSPLYIPPKTGEDKATQIEPGELFDFNLEVKPLLEVLVGKTLEQALIEVMEEEELAALRKQQREFEDLRAAQQAEVQRLEEQARRRREEKLRRVQQQAAAAALEQQAREKIAAQTFAQGYLNELLPSVFGSLKDDGFLYDKHEHEVETDFLPWLHTQVDAQTQTLTTARSLLDAMLHDVVVQRRVAFGLPTSVTIAAAAGAGAGEPRAKSPPAPVSQPAAAADGSLSVAPVDTEAATAAGSASILAADGKDTEAPEASGDAPPAGGDNADADADADAGAEASNAEDAATTAAAADDDNASPPPPATEDDNAPAPDGESSTEPAQE